MNKMLTGVILVAGMTTAQANTDLGVQGMFSKSAYGAGDRYDRYIAPDEEGFQGRDETPPEESPTQEAEPQEEAASDEASSITSEKPDVPVKKPAKLPDIIKTETPTGILPDPTPAERVEAKKYVDEQVAATILPTRFTPLRLLDLKKDPPEYPPDEMIQDALKVRQAEGKSQWRCLTKAAKAMLSRVEAKWGKLELESTCRPGAVIATSGLPSQHGYGNAVDFIAPKGKKKEVVAWLRKHKVANGIMTYSDMDHIHIDMGNYHFVALNRPSGN